MTPRLGMLAVLAALSGCATGGSSGACPPLVEYPREVQRQAAEELDRLPPGAALRRIVDDAAAMRAWVRAACG